MCQYVIEMRQPVILTRWRGPKCIRPVRPAGLVKSARGIPHTTSKLSEAEIFDGVTAHQIVMRLGSIARMIRVQDVPDKYRRI